MVQPNGLAQKWDKPLPDPVLTELLCRHMASLGHNELTYALQGYTNIIWALGQSNDNASPN